MTPAVVSLIDAAGTTRDDAGVRVADDTIVMTLPEDLPRGTHIISYRVISEDGHPVAGSHGFFHRRRDWGRRDREMPARSTA